MATSNAGNPAVLQLYLSTRGDLVRIWGGINRNGANDDFLMHGPVQLTCRAMQIGYIKSKLGEKLSPAKGYKELLFVNVSSDAVAAITEGHAAGTLLRNLLQLIDELRRKPSRQAARECVALTSDSLPAVVLQDVEIRSQIRASLSSNLATFFHSLRGPALLTQQEILGDAIPVRGRMIVDGRLIDLRGAMGRGQRTTAVAQRHVPVDW